jgi:PAS domain S-box-containing protein
MRIAAPRIREIAQEDGELADFLENAAVAIHMVASDGLILWANKAELDLVGYAASEYIGHNIAEFHADADVIDEILQSLTSGRELRDREARLRTKDGSIRDVAITSNVYRKNGRFVHSRCFTRDVTPQRHALEAQRHLAAIVESSEDAIISKDLNGIIRSWNRGAQRIFGYTPEEAIGQPIAMLAVSDRKDEFPDILSRIRRGERVEHFETRRQTKDGRVLAISLTVSPVYDANGRIIAASKIARDITERVRVEQALREANAELLRANADLEQFAYSASHDLQEPLRMVSTYTQMLKRRFGGQLGAEGDEYVGYAVEGARRMHDLLQDLLAYARAATLRDEPAEPSDANHALQAALANLRVAVEASGASVVYDRLPILRVRDAHLEQVFQNLIANGIRYQKRDHPPAIAIRCDVDGRFAHISVKDNGIGIEKQYHVHIFGMFKRLHTAADYAGTGMGLAICERIVNRAGGRIWVESQPGEGSTFHFTLPLG